MACWSFALIRFSLTCGKTSRQEKFRKWRTNLQRHCCIVLSVFKILMHVADPTTTLHWCQIVACASLTADAKQTDFYFLPTSIHASFSQSESLWISFLFGMIVDLILVLLFKHVIKWEHKWSTLVMSVVFYHLFLTIKTTCSLRVVAHVIEMLFISPFHILLFSLSLNEVVKHNIKIK